MRDHLENFINKNREQFDDKVPDLKVWADIEKRLDPPKGKRISLLRMVSVAASVIVLLSVGAYFGNNFQNQSGETIVEGPRVNVPPELVKIEQNFKEKINNKQAQLASYNYDVSVNDDLMDLDKTLNELRKEFGNVPKGSEEQIVQAMIQNYETKIAILEIVLEKIAFTNSKRGKHNEGSEM